MATEDSRKLFMAGLPESITEDTLRNLFSETGATVTEVSLPRDRATGRPRGFAFVRLGDEHQANRARQELDGRIVDGRPISVRPFHADPPGNRDGVRGDGSARGARRDSSGEGSGYDAERSGSSSVGPGTAGSERSGGNRDRVARPSARSADASDRTLYIGNLPYDASQEEIEELFASVGAEMPANVYLPVDQDGRKRGFGFVTMSSADAANAALDALRGAEIRSRRLVINIAHPKGERPATGNSSGGAGLRNTSSGGYGNGGYGNGGYGGGERSRGKGGDRGRRRDYYDGEGRGGGRGGRGRNYVDDWRSNDWDDE